MTDPAPAPRRRTPPPTVRAALMRDAGDLIGAERLARRLGIAPRTLYAQMAGKRTVAPGVLDDTRRLLVEHRQAIGSVIALIRAEQPAGDQQC